MGMNDVVVGLSLIALGAFIVVLLYGVVRLALADDREDQERKRGIPK
jgi:flagellar biogenesis protein FliO